MTVAELIEAAKNQVVSKEDIERICKIAADAEVRYAEDAKRKEVTTEMLNRVYSL